MLDTRGYACPTPVILVRNALLKEAPPTLEVLADSRVAVENITRFACSQGYAVSEVPEGADFKLVLSKS